MPHCSKCCGGARTGPPGFSELFRNSKCDIAVRMSFDSKTRPSFDLLVEGRSVGWSLLLWCTRFARHPAGAGGRPAKRKASVLDTSVAGVGTGGLAASSSSVDMLQWVFTT